MSPFVASILSILARKAIDYAKNWAAKSARPRGTWLGKASDAAVTDEAAVQADYVTNRTGSESEERISEDHSYSPIVTASGKSFITRRILRCISWTLGWLLAH